MQTNEGVESTMITKTFKTYRVAQKNRGYWLQPVTLS